MADDGAAPQQHRGRSRLLDGAIEWHPPRIAGGMLKRLRSTSSWPEAAEAMTASVKEAIGAAATRVWIVDRERSMLHSPVPKDATSPPPSQSFDPRDAEWMFSPGVRRVAARELRRDPLLQRLVGPIRRGGCGLLLTTSSEMVPTTCIGMVMDQQALLPDWVGRVLSELAVAVPLWWELHSNSLAQAKQLEAMQEDRDIAVACRGLLHDLDNAIFPIRCRLDLLFSPSKSADDLRHLDSISASIDQLAQLGLDLRSRLENTGESKSPTNLLEWWESQRLSIAGALPPGVTLLGAIPKSTPPIVMPEAPLTQAVVNLVANAGKAVGPDGVVVVSASGSGHGRVRITVSDNGAGIPAESIEALRRTIRARRAEGLPMHGSEGRRHGFGLAIVEEIVERWGGALVIESSAGKGTRMGLKVPAVPSEDQERRRAIIEVDDARRRWVIVEMLRCVGVHAMPRDAEVPVSEDGKPGGESSSRGAGVQEPDPSATIWIVDGPSADSPALLEWLEAEEDRLAIALGKPTRSHARLRHIEAPGDEAAMLAALQELIDRREGPDLAFSWGSMDGSPTPSRKRTAGRHRGDDAGGA